MEEKKTKPQYARIEQPFGYPPPVVHCPICGQKIFNTYTGKIIPCPHLAFAYTGGSGEYDYIYIYTSDDYTQKTKHSLGDSMDLEKFPRLLKKAGYGNNLLVLEITYCGMAGGPVWYTDVYGFDYAVPMDAEKE